MSHSESQGPLAVHSSGMEGYCMSHSESQGPLAVHSSGMVGPACLTHRVKVHLLYILVEWKGLHVSP